MVDGPDAFRRMLLERSGEHEINPINTARNVGAVLREWLLKPCEKQGVGRGKHRCIERQMQNARNLAATASNAAVLWDSAVQGVNLGSLHRIHVDAARAAFKLSRETQRCTGNASTRARQFKY